MEGRGAGATPAQEAAILQAVSELEASGGLDSPVDSPAIEGAWRLLFTTKSKFDPRNPLGARVDGTAPGLEAVARSLFGAPAAASSSPVQRSVTGNAALSVVQVVELRGATPVVDAVVSFSDVATFLLRASASADGPNRRRIDFCFESGYLDVKKPFRVRLPYPVPFKLLGDEAKGWLDTTYLSPRVRISRGNKGTCFVLERAPEEDGPR